MVHKNKNNIKQTHMDPQYVLIDSHPSRLHFLLWLCSRISIKDFANLIPGERHTLIGSFKFMLRYWKQEGMLCVDQKGIDYAN